MCPLAHQLTFQKFPSLVYEVGKYYLIEFFWSVRIKWDNMQEPHQCSGRLSSFFARLSAQILCSVVQSKTLSLKQVLMWHVLEETPGTSARASYRAGRVSLSVPAQRLCSPSCELCSNLHDSLYWGHELKETNGKKWQGLTRMACRTSLPLNASFRKNSGFPDGFNQALRAFPMLHWAPQKLLLWVGCWSWVSESI